MRIGTVILAGGEGRRIGGGKALRSLAGRTLLQHALERARGWSEAVAVSVREAGNVEGPEGVSILMDGLGQGPIAGIASALRFARDAELDAVLTIPCDTPFLPPDLLDRLSDALAPAVRAAVAASGGRLHPSCTLWRADAAEALLPYLEAGRSSLKGFAAEVGMASVEWPTGRYDPFFNINDAEDLAAAEALIRME